VLCTFESADGLTLRAETLGDQHAPPVVLLHGGGQTRHAWRGTAAALAADGRRAIAVDQRGHGDSDWSPDGDYGLDAYADDVRAIVAALPESPVLVGASLGGLASLLALGEPPFAGAAALVLVDVAHRFEPAGRDRVIAFMRDGSEGFADPQEAAAAVSAYLPHRQAPPDPDGLRKNLRLRDGRWRWHWDPSMLAGPASLADPVAAAALAERLTAAVAQVTIPILLVRGAISDVVSRSIADEFAALAPHARVVEVPRAAHMVAGDDNDRFTQTVTEFLTTIG
jgi:pimeloyl-ACP methyl ester carboxylesterase